MSALFFAVALTAWVGLCVLFWLGWLFVASIVQKLRERRARQWASYRLFDEPVGDWPNLKCFFHGEGSAR